MGAAGFEPATSRVLVGVDYLRSRLMPNRVSGPSAPCLLLVGEGHRTAGRELHQRSGALEFGIVDELALIEAVVVEADRAYVEAPALLDVLLVYACDRRGAKPTRLSGRFATAW